MVLRMLLIFSVFIVLTFSFMTGSPGFCGTVTYEYDHLNRVIKSERQEASTLDYSYDMAGNRTSADTQVESPGYDHDSDGDVDGLDLHELATGSNASGTELLNFANVFGTQN